MPQITLYRQEPQQLSGWHLATPQDIIDLLTWVYQQPEAMQIYCTAVITQNKTVTAEIGGTSLTSARATIGEYLVLTSTGFETLTAEQVGEGKLYNTTPGGA